MCYNKIWDSFPHTKLPSKQLGSSVNLKNPKITTDPVQMCLQHMFRAGLVCKYCLKFVLVAKSDSGDAYMLLILLTRIAHTVFCKKLNIDTSCVIHRYLHMHTGLLIFEQFSERAYF